MSNHNKQNMNSNSSNKSDFWLSLEQYNGDPEFAKRAENEFMSSPYSVSDGENGFARRDFLKLMGASIALATTACVRRPVQHIIPYAQAPKDYIPGIPNFYASSWFDGVEGYGILAKTVDGRPIKLEGNPLHAMNLGGLTARAHAEVLALYDPDRLRAPVRNLANKTRTNHETVSAKFEDADKAILEALAKGGVAILTSTLPSPSEKAMVSDFQKAYAGTRWVQYDALPADSVVEGQRRSYGKAVMPRYRMDKADLIVAIEADFLGTYISPAEFMKQWSKRRKPGQTMNRLVSFDSTMSLTSMNADDRVRIKPSQQVDVALALLDSASKASHGSMSLPEGVRSSIKEGGDFGARLGMDPALLAKVGEQLWAARGKGLVIAGGTTTMTAEAVDLQVAVNMLNSLLGNDGKTVDHESAAVLTREGSAADMATLIADMAAGKVKTLIVHNLNVGYVLPVDAGFREAAAKVPLIVYTGNSNDETGRIADYVLPAGTTLESWGDYEFQTGLFSIQQPTISPLWDSRSFGESLHVWTLAAAGGSGNVPARVKASKDWYEFVRGIWKTEIAPKAAKGQGFDDFWANVLQTGVADVSKRESDGSSRAVAVGAWTSKGRKAQEGYELALFPTVQIADGRYANVSWLQELPDPTTKMVWDNYVMVSTATARKEKLREGDMIELTLGKKSVKAPVHIQPGMHDDVLALALGYGRPDAGGVGKNVGVNGYDLASFNAGKPVFAGLVTTIEKTGESYDLVSTQHHHVMEGRQIVVETTNTSFQKDPSSGIHRHKIFSIWPSHQYTKHRWAMSIDLNACTGCSACMMACQSENNIPVVGKRYVMEGREMHWIRIDRYYKGDPVAPESVFQPMLCQQCESAPCETVCPVLATVHNDEGLNDMVYNRCVGTRYCSNNCPYKVRRFNWFYFAKRAEPLEMQLNPEVTVRTRGVMEKCTFCVQRIRHVTSVEKNAKTRDKLKDGEIKTACQQSCPTDAITFGDLADKESAVSKLFEDGRSYPLLEELNTRPRVRYQSRVRNAERAEVAAEHSPEHSSGPGHKEEKPNERKGEASAAPTAAPTHQQLQQESERA